MTGSTKGIYAEIGRKMREMPLDTTCLSYEWEELVQKLCDSDDDGLHAIGVRELDVLRKTCPNCPVFGRCS